MYRFRNRVDGLTRRSLKEFQHLEKIGTIREIVLYVVNKKTEYGMIPTPRVLVRGDKGTCRFGGLLWGYMGEGPRALVELLDRYSKRSFLINPAFVKTLPNDYYSMNGQKKIRIVHRMRIAQD